MRVNSTESRRRCPRPHFWCIVLNPNWLFVITVMVMFPATVSSQTFTRTSVGPHVTDSGQSMGVVWVDYDGDSDLDIFVANGNTSRESNALYRNDGAGNYSSVDAGALTTDLGLTNGSTWGDFDGDGDQDAYIITRRLTGGGSSLNTFYRNEGGGSFSRVDSSILSTDTGNSNSSSMLDIDRDGDLDLFVINFGEPNFRYINDGTGQFQRVFSGSETSTSSLSAVGIWGDADDDGNLDLYVANTGNTANNFFRNQGDGSFVRITDGDFVNRSGSTLGGSWGDYDNDGDLDLFVANFLGQNNFLFENNGDGTFNTVSSGPVATDGGRSVGSAWVDVDNDGDLDLLVTNDGERNALYENNGLDGFSRRDSGDFVSDASATFGLAYADFDNDGDVDVYAANRDGSPNSFFINDGNTNHWFNVALKSTVSNPAGIGSRVRVLTTTSGQSKWQMREIVSQTGYNGQSSLRATFGLGDASTVDSLIVEWPSGKKDAYTTLAADQFFTATEGEAPVSVTVEEERDEIPASFAVVSTFPNPFSERTNISVQLSTAGSVTIDIFDGLGRHVLRPVTDRFLRIGPASFSVGASTLPGSGVFYYRVTFRDMEGRVRILTGTLVSVD